MLIYDPLVSMVYIKICGRFNGYSTQYIHTEHNIVIHNTNIFSIVPPALIVSLNVIISREIWYRVRMVGGGGGVVVCVEI